MLRLDKKLRNEQRHICRESRKCCNSYFSPWLRCEMSSQLAFLPIASSQPLIIALIKALWGRPLFSICFKVLLKAGWRMLFNICHKVTSEPTSLAPTSVFLSCGVSLLCYCYLSYLAPWLQHCWSVWSVNYWIAVLLSHRHSPLVEDNSCWLLWFLDVSSSTTTTSSTFVIQSGISC